MTGSIAEERIRAKAEVLLRRLFPSGRIIHELGVGSYGSSVIDLASVTPDLIAGIEVKSERDVLTRLPRQYRYARKVVDLYALCAAPAVAEKVKRLQQSHTDEYEDQYVDGRLIGHRAKANPEYIPDLADLDVLVEADDGFCPGYSWASDNNEFSVIHRLNPAILNPSHRLEMLWAEELRAIAAPFGVTARSNRGQCINMISEGMTGREVRRAVCAALRRRTFARADQSLTT